MPHPNQTYLMPWRQVNQIVPLTKIDISNPKLNPTKQRVNLQTRRKTLWKLRLNLPFSEQQMAEQLIIEKVREANELIELIEDRDEQLEVQPHQHDEQPRRHTHLLNRRRQLPCKHEQQLRRYAEHGQKQRRHAQQQRRHTELELNVAFGTMAIK